MVLHHDFSVVHDSSLLSNDEDRGKGGGEGRREGGSYSSPPGSPAAAA